MKQSLIITCSLGIALQSLAEPRVCSAVFLNEPTGVARSTLAELALPLRVRHFNSDLYWSVLSGETPVQNLSKKELKSLEVKMAMIDSVMPSTSKRWMERLPELSVLRVREINGLIASYQLKDFKDNYLRDRFVTQLYVLMDSPWTGLVKSIDLARKETMQQWASRNLEQQLLSKGLQGVVEQIGSGDRVWLEQARLYLKKFRQTGLLGLPAKLPMINKDLDPDTAEKILWEGADPKFKNYIREEYGAEIYNQFSRNYNRVALTILIASLYYLIPQIQQQFEEAVRKRMEEHANDPENVKKRDKAFDQAMDQLDEMGKKIDELNQVDSKEQMYQDTLNLFESMNHRKATPEEAASLRKKLGL